MGGLLLPSPSSGSIGWVLFIQLYVNYWTRTDPISPDSLVLQANAGKIEREEAIGRLFLSLLSVSAHLSKSLGLLFYSAWCVVESGATAIIVFILSTNRLTERQTMCGHRMDLVNRNSTHSLAADKSYQRRDNVGVLKKGKMVWHQQQNYFFFFLWSCSTYWLHEFRLFQMTLQSIFHWCQLGKGLVHRKDDFNSMN